MKKDLEKHAENLVVDELAEGSRPAYEIIAKLQQRPEITDSQVQQAIWHLIERDTVEITPELTLRLQNAPHQE